MASYTKYTAAIEPLNEQINAGSDTWKLALSNTINAADTSFVAGTTDLPTSGGYTAGGITLSTASAAQSGGTYTLTFTQPGSPAWTATGAPLGFVITTPTVVQIDSGAGSGKYKPTADDVIHWLRTLFPRKQAQSKPRKRERESVSVVRQYAKRVESVSHAELDRALSDARELDALIQAYRQYLDAEQALQIQRAIDDEVGRKLAAYFAREAEQRARHAIVQWIKRQDDELAFLLIALEV